MTASNIRKKLNTGYKSFREGGLSGLSIKTLEYLQKKQRQKGNPKFKINIDTGAIYDDLLTVDLTKGANAQWKAPTNKKHSLRISWLMPPPGKGSGGHMTLFRFIKYFEDTGHTCRIYFHNPGKGSTIEAVRTLMGDGFPEVNAEMSWLQQGADMEDCDVLFATSWQTAYTVYNSSVKAKKFYFVQDFEPYFYPTGTHSILANNTYRLGLRGITAGGWLSSRLNKEYGMTATPFDFGSDSDTYHYDNPGKRKEIVYYVRPTTPRRAFELGIVVLDLFHRMHPEYTINFIGWDVAEYNIPFPYNNLGILSHDELNTLYNRCAASLVMSLTNMSLLPLELISSGCIPVVNEGDNNRLVSNNPYIRYADSDPLTLAKALSSVVVRKDLPKYAKKASDSVKGCSWDESGDKIVKEVIKAYHTDGNG